jgi:hypothetical protein
MPLLDYSFYVAILRFIARKTERSDPKVAQMMDALLQAAAEIEASGRFTVAAEQLETTARAFAGVGAFLQRQILPEVVAEINDSGERQVRWAVDAAMGAVNTLLARAVETPRLDVEITLDAPPD